MPSESHKTESGSLTRHKYKFAKFCVHFGTLAKIRGTSYVSKKWAKERLFFKKRKPSRNPLSNADVTDCQRSHLPLIITWLVKVWHAKIIKIIYFIVGSAKPVGLLQSLGLTCSLYTTLRQLHTALHCRKFSVFFVLKWQCLRAWYLIGKKITEANPSCINAAGNLPIIIRPIQRRMAVGLIPISFAHSYDRVRLPPSNFAILPTL